ncbi:putative zinc protease-like protein y4wB [Porphyridium purpureum]|uniref:Putative zinc protease-like protein y4wB n=1 Tax=Porphyridium purpureum TaxID=35688 RepID=A0A5J4YV81_PORPP|nr:putative zinc protease-like protein y4wB [Porphyridium purpureum]|eukprot:POR4005..scf227_4
MHRCLNTVHTLLRINAIPQKMFAMCSTICSVQDESEANGSFVVMSHCFLHSSVFVGAGGLPSSRSSSRYAVCMSGASDPPPGNSVPVVASPPSLKRCKAVFAGIAAAAMVVLLGQQEPAVAFTAGPPVAASQIELGRAHTTLEFAPLAELKLPQYTRLELQNGLQIYLMEDHQVPLVSGSIVFHAGTRVEPMSKKGLASIYASVLRLGGSESLPGKQLDVMLEDRAASIEAGADSSSFGVSFACLREDLEVVLSLMADVLQHPALPEAEMARAQQRALGGIARRNDDPNAILSREMAKVVYGENSPYALTAEKATIRALTREDLIGYHARYMAPNNALMGIVGDFDSKALAKQLRDLYDEKQWPRNERATAPEVPNALASADSQKGTISLAEKREVSQAYVRMGHLGGRLDDPDYYALDVMNSILNGLGGRLFNEIRSKAGLAYSVSGSWYPAFDHEGVFYAGGETDAKNTGAFIRKMLDVLSALDKDPPTAQEVEDAKRSTLNSFVFNFESPADVLSRVIKYAFYNYPEDFAEQYPKRIAKVTPQDVAKVLNQRVEQDRFSFVVVGEKAKILPSLQKELPSLPIRERDVRIKE